MKISAHIINEAMEILEERMSLPQQIRSAPLFHLADASDKSIHAFSSIEHEGKNYKIGTLKKQTD